MAQRHWLAGPHRVSGMDDLSSLLDALRVIRHDGVWRFATQAQPPDPSEAIFAFREREGWSALYPATERTPVDNRWVWLELAVVSDLNAVGFLAALAARLAQAGVACNAIAGYYHDHLFVPEGQAGLAIEALERRAGPA